MLLLALLLLLCVRGKHRHLFLLHFLGIAINKDGVIYFADGANIRKIDSEGIIHTLIGSQGHPKYFQPLPCYTVTDSSEVIVDALLHCTFLTTLHCAVLTAWLSGYDVGLWPADFP